MMKNISLFFILLASLVGDLSAEEHDGNVYLSLSIFNETDGVRSGAEASMLLNAKRNFAVRLSHVLFFVDDPSEVNEFFEGFSISGYYHLGQKIINPYVGVGVFSGEIYNCSREDENRGLCDNKFVLAIYPEFGVAFNIGNVQIYPFVRRYYDTNSPTGNISAYGLHLGLKY